MLDQPKENDALRARIAEVEAQQVPIHEVLSWFAPWFVAAVLVLVCIGALWCASTASDDLTYAIGLIGAALALVALVWEGVAALSGGLADWSLPMAVDDDTSLVVLMTLLGILALGGLVLAARGQARRRTASDTGFASSGLSWLSPISSTISIASSAEPPWRRRAAHASSSPRRSTLRGRKRSWRS